MAINATIPPVHIHGLGAFNPATPRQVYAVSEKLSHLLVQHDAGFFFRVTVMACSPCMQHNCEYEGCPVAHRCWACRKADSYAEIDGLPWACVEHSTHAICGWCEETFPKGELHHYEGPLTYSHGLDVYCSGCEEKVRLDGLGINDCTGRYPAWCTWTVEGNKENQCGKAARWQTNYHGRTHFFCDEHVSAFGNQLIAEREQAAAAAAADPEDLPFG